MKHDDTTYMVWYDKDKKIKQETKLKRAIQYYTSKYGVAPNEVVVNQADIELKSDIPIRSESFVNTNHFYLPIPDT